MDTYLKKIIGSSNTFTNEQISEAFTRWPTSLNTCVARSNSFKALKDKLIEQPTSVEDTRLQLISIQKTLESLEPLLRETSDVEKEGYSQVLFEGIPWSEINYLPYALVCVSIFKSYIVPAASIMLPLLSWILPYIFLRVVYNIPIEFTDYMNLLWRMWNGRPIPRTPEELMQPYEEPVIDAGTRIKQILQNGWTIFTLGQALWQPIQQAKHFMKLDSDCLHLGESILKLKEESVVLYKSWKPWLPVWFLEWITMCPSDLRQAFAFVHDTPYWLIHMCRSLGRFEGLFLLAARPDTVPATFINSKRPILVLHDFGDPSIQMEKRILSSICLGAKGTPSHAIVTGPNRGGKSSCMRGVLLNAMTAHVFGAAFAKKAQLSYLSWIADGMRLDDFPGTLSMFEREVSFASSILRKTTGGNGIVLYDELFHSTNPPDAIRTSELFCNNLWKKTNCISVISTHVYSLARNAPEDVKTLCVAAKNNDGVLEFSYKLKEGICEVSSVDLLLKQHSIL
jgi:hypothetical protein